MRKRRRGASGGEPFCLDGNTFTVSTGPPGVSSGIYLNNKMPMTTMFSIMLTTTNIARPTGIGGGVRLDVLNSRTLKSDEGGLVVSRATDVVVYRPVVVMDWNEQAHQERRRRSNNLRTVPPRRFVEGASRYLHFFYRGRVDRHRGGCGMWWWWCSSVWRCWCSSVWRCWYSSVWWCWCTLVAAGHKDL